jgi:HAD superfamily hydrolase (TIGR01490 family)
MKRNLAIFDLDNTILNGDSDYSWINFLIDMEYVDKDEYERKNQYFYDKYYEGTLDYDEWAEFALSTIKGKKPNDLKDLITKFMSSVIEPMINVYALRLLHNHHHNNDVMLLASATNSVIVNPIAMRLGFENIVATDVEIVDGVYSGKMKGIAALGEGKLHKVREWMLDNNFNNFNNVTFYSDSINDFPLLAEVSKPIAVNPDNKLRKECERRAWKIIDLP